MKRVIFGAMMLTGVVAYAQDTNGKVGINTQAPQATLDIQPSAANLAGTTNEGLIIPKLTKARVLAIATPVEGTQVYVTDDVLEADNTHFDGIGKGYYFYNGTKWVKFVDTNSNAEGDEWVYDPATKQINLKRSGTTTDFTNKVFYTKDGWYKNVDEVASEYFDRGIGQVVQGTNPDISTIDGAKRFTILANSKKLKPSISTNTKTSSTSTSKGLYEFNLVLDESSAINNPFSVTAGHSLTTIASTNQTPTSWVNGGNFGVTKQDNQPSTAIIGSAHSAIINKGTIKGYAIGAREEVYADTPDEVNHIAGVRSYTTAGKYTKKVNLMEGYGLNFNVYGSPTIKDAAAVNVEATISETENPTITNYTGFRYNGIYSGKSNPSKNITNHYGLYVGNVDKAQNNYAIYTNAGHIRFGDLASTSATDKMVVVDANGVLKIGAAGASAISSTATMECNADNRGKMNFVPNDNGNDVFGICMRNADGNYYWGYMVGGNNPTNGTGTFGSGL